MESSALPPAIIRSVVMLLKKRLLASVLKVGAVFVFSFLLLELMLLVFNDAVFRSSFYIFDPDLGFRVRPYAVYGNETANEFGFNDRDYPHEPSAGTFRIEILGDSFNWMGGQKGNYTAILEQNLAEEWGPGKIEVISAGYSQTHTGEQLRLLKKFGLQYQPDLLILGFFAGNDFYDADPKRRRIVVGGATTDIFAGKDLFLNLGGNPLVLKSRLFLYLEEIWRAYQHRQQLKAGQALSARRWEPRYAGVPPLGTAPGAAPEAHALPVMSSEYLKSIRLRGQFFSPDHFSEYEPNVLHVFESLREMNQLLRSRGIDFVVAAYPDEVQVSPEIRAHFLEVTGIDASHWEWLRPQNLLEEFCAKEGITFWDLTDTFRNNCRADRPLYIPNDSHWDAAGNRLAAEFLQGRLRERLGSWMAEQSHQDPVHPTSPVVETGTSR